MSQVDGDTSSSFLVGTLVLTVLAGALYFYCKSGKPAKATANKKSETTTKKEETFEEARARIKKTCSPFYYECCSPNLMEIRTMVNDGADLNAVNPANGFTPLMELINPGKNAGPAGTSQGAPARIDYEKLQMVKVLLAAGANCLLRDKEMKTVYQHLLQRLQAHELVLAAKFDANINFKPDRTEANEKKWGAEMISEIGKLMHEQREKLTPEEKKKMEEDLQTGLARIAWQKSGGRFK